MIPRALGAPTTDARAASREKELKLKKTLLSLSACALATGLALTGCGSNTDAGSEQTSAPSSQQAETVTVEDPWIKATDSDMTAMFGTVTNPTAKDRTIVKADADGAGMVQLHETVPTSGGSTEMREKKDGFPLPASGSTTLEPGADHVMLMGLKKELAAGDTLKVTLTLDDDSTVEVEAPVKPFSGAKESYAPSEEAAMNHDDHGDHGDHGEHGDH